jgi:hypothetical protein
MALIKLLYTGCHTLAVAASIVYFLSVALTVLIFTGLGVWLVM